MLSANRVPDLSRYDDLLALPENLVGEIIDGVLYTQPRPAGPHNNAEICLASILNPSFQKGRGGPGGWWIQIEPELHFIRDTEIAVPDLAGWRRERMPFLPRDHRYEVVPDWVCEILSPATAKKDRTLKMPLYARHGVVYLWLVEPLQHTLEVFELQAGRWILAGILKDAEPVSMPPFEALSFSLADLWSEANQDPQP
ncbi:MAG: Uma2 family endonuclease [Methylococcales bacterium]